MSRNYLCTHNSELRKSNIYESPLKVGKIRHCNKKLHVWAAFLEYTPPPATPYLLKTKEEFFHSDVNNVILESRSARHDFFKKTSRNNWVKFKIRIRCIPFGTVGNWYAHYYKEDFVFFKTKTSPLNRGMINDSNFQFPNWDGLHNSQYIKILN